MSLRSYSDQTSYEDWRFGQTDAAIRAIAAFAQACRQLLGASQSNAPSKN